MEFRQLTYFLTAAQTQNFRKAAELCMVAQSALSRQIAALESELGVELFRRVERRVILTEAGQEFTAYARTALGQLQQGQQAMIELKAGERGLVTLGCVEALATTFLPRVFARFHQLYPQIRLRVSVRGADELMQLVERESLDFGLVFDPTSHSELLVVRELFRQPLQLVVSPRHRLVQLPLPLRFEEIVTEPLVLFREGFGLRRIVERVFAQRGFALHPLVEIDSIEALKEFVKQGVGPSFITEALLRPEQLKEDLRLLPVADLTEEFIFGLVYRRVGTVSMATRGLIEAITGSIKSIANNT